MNSVLMTKYYDLPRISRNNTVHSSELAAMQDELLPLRNTNVITTIRIRTSPNYIRILSTSNTPIPSPSPLFHLTTPQSSAKAYSSPPQTTSSSSHPPNAVSSSPNPQAYPAPLPSPPPSPDSISHQPMHPLGPPTATAGTATPSLRAGPDPQASRRCPRCCPG
jgi:hypothetical protein